MTQITVELPEDLAEALEYWATAAGRTTDRVISDLLRTGMRRSHAHPRILEALPSGLVDVEAIRTRVTDFLEEEITAFLEAHPGEVFSNLALDTNLDYGQILISANTNKLFEETLASYQQHSSDAQAYRTEEGIRSLRTNPGDWGYPTFAELRILTQSELDEIQSALPFNNPYLWGILAGELMEVIATAFIDFRATKVFQRMPVTSDFHSFCIDHDESYEDASTRMISVAFSR